MTMTAVSTPPRIHLARRTEDGILAGADTAHSLGIVFTELVTNAVKHAFRRRDQERSLFRLGGAARSGSRC
jgi:two-component sensor histidine kinase